METGIDSQALSHAEVVLCIEGEFMATVNLLRVGKMEGGVDLDLAALHFPVDCGHALRDEGVPDVFGTELHQMAR